MLEAFKIDRQAALRALESAAKTLKSDPEFMLKAVEQDWHALQYAAKSLKADPAIVLKAVEQDWHALAYAAEPDRKSVV